MTKIYTKTGDNGKTSLLNGKQVCKCCLEMEVVGEIDELNAALGVLCSHLEDEKVKKDLQKIQQTLFIAGSNVAALQSEIEIKTKINEQDIVFLEKWIDKMDNSLEELTDFIIPGGHKAAAQSQMARTICRRAERSLIALSKKYEVDPLLKKYLNRLSDFLFVLARWINKVLDT